MNTVIKPTQVKPTTVRQPRSRLPAVAAVVGLLLAVGWAVFSLQMGAAARHEQQQRAQQQAHVLVELMRTTVQARAAADAQRLAQDPRLQSTLATANVDDATILDILQDLQKLNSQALFAVLSPAGRVRVQLGAPKMEGLDLSSSAVVKAALAQESAALGTWMVDDRVEEVAVIGVKAGERVVALLAIGNRLDDASLGTVARAAQVNLALLVDELPVWTSAVMPVGTWFQPAVERIEVKGSTPPARFVASAIPVEDPAAPLVWVVPGLAFVFALLAFWRGGAR